MLDSLKTLSSKNELWPSPFITRKARGTQTENVFCQQTVDVTAQSKTHQKYFMQHFKQRIRQKSGRCHLNKIGKGDGFKSKVY